MATPATFKGNLMSNFAAALLKSTEGKDGEWEGRAHRIASNPDKPHNARVLKRLEERVRGHEGFDPSSIIDWFKQNWKSILQVVISLLPLLLMFLGPDPDAVVGAEDAVGFPGENLFFSFLANRSPAYLRKKIPTIPGTDQELGAMVTSELKEFLE